MGNFRKRHHRQLGVYYTDDSLEGVRAVDVRGSDQPCADELLDALAPRLRVYSPQDLLGNVDRARGTQQLRRAVYWLTFAAHPTCADRAVLTRVDACARHSDPVVRAAAAYAMGNAFWAEYRPVLSRLLSDGDVEVRAMAHRVAVAYEQDDLPHIFGGDRHRRTEPGQLPSL